MATSAGLRHSQEDSYILHDHATASGSAGVFAVLDGHGGPDAAATGGRLLDIALTALLKHPPRDATYMGVAIQESFFCKRM